MTLPFSRRRFLASAILIVTTATGLAEDKGNPKRWPSIHRPTGKAKIVLTKKGQGQTPYIYHTKHFELRSPDALSQRHLQKFATVAESVPRVLAKFPLPLLGMPEGGRAKVLIFPDEESFVKNGGAYGAAGYYSGRKQAIMLRADTFLQPPSPASSRLPPKADYDLLVHEFVHLCMHRDLGYLPTWFSEGVAEYIAAAHTNDGVYRFDNITSEIRNRIKAGLPNDKEHIRMPSVKETMQLTSESWREKLEHGDDADGYRLYASSLLIVHTLFHGGEKRRADTRTFLQNLRPRKLLNQKVELLIPEKDRDQLQQRISNYWRPRGLRIKFESDSDS